MAEYGPGLTLGQRFNYDKERIKHALAGELLCGEDENGFVYELSTKEECEAYILSAFDEAVFQCLQANDSGRAMERIMRNHGLAINMPEYMREVEKAHREFNDYVYENTEEEDEK